MSYYDDGCDRVRDARGWLVCGDFGFGYSAKRVAELLNRVRWRVIADEPPPEGVELDVWREGDGRLVNYVWTGSRWEKKVGYPVATRVLAVPPTHWAYPPEAPTR